MSTRSIRKSHHAPETEPIDPEIAKVHAAAAASHAMRSSERSSTDSKTPYDRLGGPAHVAVPKRRPNSSLHFTDDSLSMYSGSVATPVTPRQSMDRAGTIQNQRLADSAVLAPTTDLRGLDGRDSSVPSSYRRLRKAKSMFSTRQRASHLSYGVSPKLPRDSGDADQSPGFELPRTQRPSISFIRGNNRQGGRVVRHTKSQDAAIQLARSQFLEEANTPGGQIRRSSFFTSRRTREHKPFRKTFRIASGTGIGTESPEQANPKHAGSKSRAFSASIKHGLKRVFGLSKSGDVMNSAADHSSGFAKAVEIAPGYQASNLTSGSEETQTCGRMSPLPTTQMQASLGRDSPCTSASRVTSWADSTAANTIVTRKTGHRQSLSLIEEHGDLNQQLPRIPTSVSADIQSSPSKRASTRNFDNVVNSQDLYTALMQQIGRNSMHDPDEGIHFGTVPEHRVIPERTSSVYSHRSKRSIRHVQSGESTPVSFATAHRGDSQSPQRQRSTRHIPPARASQYFKVQPAKGFSVARSPQFGHIVDAESEESTGSVIIAREEDANPRSISPSIYSRTTSGGTPPGKEDDSDGDTPTFHGETGTATIYESQRHSSPTRTLSPENPSARVQSADWQQWVNSQIERIEKATPTREHFRENAQIQEDYDDEIFMGTMRRAPPQSLKPTAVPYVFEPDEQEREVEPPTVTKMPMQSNFSRPFSRSSSVRTIASQRPEANGAVTHSSNHPDVDTVANPPLLPARSPMRALAGNLPGGPDSPTPRHKEPGPEKRAWTQEQYRRYSVRRPIANGRSNRFRSMRSYRDFRPLVDENARHEEHEEMMDDYHRAREFQASMSSKHMVEMFLNSRRRPAEIDPAEGGGDGAFL